MALETVSSDAISIAIVEDDRATREALHLLIDGTAGFKSLARFASVDEALAGLSGVEPDLLLLDIHLPGMSGSQGVGLLRERYPRTQVVMLTVFAGEDRIFESLCNGACGYLLKRTPPARLIDALREAHEGGSPMSPEIARKVVAAFQKKGSSLTPHEVRIVRMLADGDSYQEIGGRLGVTVNTVRSYIRSIYEKLQVNTKAEAVSKAMRSRLIT